tara:strand:+ start:159 stop:515 length:357 start_codon:yes stop_codon:yes gene_type:complete
MEDTKGIVALDEDGEVQGGFLADSFTYASCQGHIWINKKIILKYKFLEEICYYVYGTCGLTTLIATISFKNHKSLKLMQNIGFTELAVIKDGFKLGEHMMIMTMRAEECRFFKQEEAA